MVLSPTFKPLSISDADTRFVYIVQISAHRSSEIHSITSQHLMTDFIFGHLVSIEKEIQD